MIYTKTITLNSFVDEKGYLRETDSPFYLKINRFVTTDSYSGFSKQFYIVRNDENRESLRKVELLRWLLCDDLFFLVFGQCFEVTGKLKQSVIEGIATNVAYTQIMSPILNKNKRRPTTVNLLKKINEYIVLNPEALQNQMDHLKANIEESEFYSSVYAADKTYYDYLAMEKAIVQGKPVESEQANCIMHLLKTSYDDKYHGQNNVVKVAICRSLGWSIPVSHSEELALYRRLTALVIESITEEDNQLQEVLQNFVESGVKNTTYNRWDYEKPFTELHITIQKTLEYPGELFRVSNGFLTSQFYKYLFSHAKKRFYICAVANDNLFSSETIEDLKTMMRRVKTNGLDFRCIFASPDKSNTFLDLDPDSDMLRKQIQDNFHTSQEFIKSLGLDPQDYVRTTHTMLGHLMIIVDDAILYRNPFEGGIAFSNTVNLPFYVLYSESKGAFMALEDFLRCWDRFTAINYIYNEL